MLESSQHLTNYASWPPTRLHSKLPRWKHLLLQLLYVREADHQEGAHGMLDPQVDLRGGGGANDLEGSREGPAGGQ
jgi:hypothetical protein